MSTTDNLIQKALDSKAPKDIVNAFLANTGKDDIENVSKALVAQDATYISLSFENEELKQIEPWAGTQKGRQAFIETFSNVGTYWDINNFEVTDMIGEEDKVAVFGSFTYTSVEVQTKFTSPFSILVKIKDGQIVYFQFMEDTYLTASSFRTKGEWEIQNNGKTFTVGK